MDRRLTDRHLLPCQPSPKLGQRDIRPLGNPLSDLFCMPRQRIPLVPAKFIGADPAGRAPALYEPAHRAQAYAIKLRDLFTGVAGLDCSNRGTTQVFRIRLPHPRLASSSSRELESHFSAFG